MIKNETTKTTYYRGTIQQYYEYDSKEMLNFYFQFFYHFFCECN